MYFGAGTYTSAIASPCVTGCSVGLLWTNTTLDVVYDFFNNKTNIVLWHKFDGNILDSSDNNYHAISGTSSFDSTNKKVGDSSIAFPATNGIIEFNSGVSPYNIWNTGFKGMYQYHSFIPMIVELI
jgi:hypothetical protein